MRVGLVFGGRSVEHLVSIRSARTVLQGLREAGHEVVCLYLDEAGGCHGAEASEAVIEAQAPLPPSEAPARTMHVLVDAIAGADGTGGVEAIFPIIHGTYGEDGKLQGLLEMLDVPYVGCSTAASAVAMDKVLSKRLFAAAGIPVVPGVHIDRAAFSARGLDDVTDFAATHGYPLFVKPAVGGSSVGCVKVKDASALHDAVAFALRFDEVAIIEQGVSAREVELAVLGHRAATMEASVPGEIVPGGDFYDYADKYLKDDAKLLAPAPIEPDLLRALQENAIKAMAAIGGHGLARVDFFVLHDATDGQRFFLNEINTLPGFTSVSMYPRLWALSGVALPALCDRLVQLAVARHTELKKTDAALRDFVRSVHETSTAPHPT